MSDSRRFDIDRHSTSTSKSLRFQISRMYQVHKLGFSSDILNNSTHSYLNFVRPEIPSSYDAT